MNALYLSMGALVMRRNGYDTDCPARVIPELTARGFIDGAEFMMIKKHYENTSELVKKLLSAGCVFPTFHTDKDIGTRLSDAAVIWKSDRLKAEKIKSDAVDMFRYNCEAASLALSKRLVLHLWGGLNSDKAVELNAEWLSELIPIAKEYGLQIMCENVPSAAEDPLVNWHRIEKYLPDIGLVFDTRFATCHRQSTETLDDPIFEHCNHVHISDYRGGFKEFSCLRPVWHPTEGICDFPLIFSRLREMNYEGSFTLESPGILKDGGAVQISLLEKSLTFIKNGMLH